MTATDEETLSDLLLSFIGIFNLFLISLCTFSGTPALSLQNRIVSFFSNLNLVYEIGALVVINTIL